MLVKLLRYAVQAAVALGLADKAKAWLKKKAGEAVKRTSDKLLKKYAELAAEAKTIEQQVGPITDPSAQS